MINVSVRGRAAALAVLAGAGFGSLALAGPAGASADALKTVKILASCATSLSPTSYSNYAASVTTNAPATVAPGKPVSLTSTQFKVTVPGSVVKLAVNYGYTTASGTVKTLDIKASDAKTGTSTQNLGKVPFKFGPITLTVAEESTGVTVALPAKAVTLAGFVSGIKGTMKFTPGPVSIAATFKNKSGSTLPVTLTCKPGTAVLNSTAVS
jgi:hypothetical protein